MGSTWLKVIFQCEDFDVEVGDMNSEVVAARVPTYSSASSRKPGFSSRCFGLRMVPGCLLPNLLKMEPRRVKSSAVSAVLLYEEVMYTSDSYTTGCRMLLCVLEFWHLLKDGLSLCCRNEQGLRPPRSRRFRRFPISISSDSYLFSCPCIP